MESERQAEIKRVGNVPNVLESFVGRTDKLQELTQRLSVSRLVTISGVGGGGKTRLALEFAAQKQQSGEFPDGVWIAELDSVGDEDMLYQAVLTAVDAPGQSTREPLATLLEYLQNKSMLLVLDNCEHLGRTVGKLAITLLRATHHLRILTTSRGQLGAAGEAVVSVHPMTVPREDAPLPAAPYEEYEAVQLFHMLVTASVPGWEITQDNWPYVVQVLRGVDGIPLAIRLVTVRLRTMGIRELATRMHDLFPLLNKNDLAPDQHETLEAVFRWNFTNCTEAEKVLWARASVFAGTFTLDAAERVCSDGELPRELVADALRGLVESSTLETNLQRTRFRLLVPLRQFGTTLLTERGEEDVLLAQRRDYYVDVAARAASNWYRGDEYMVLNETAEDLPNFAAVMRSYIVAPDEAQTGLQLAINLARTRLYFYLGRMREAISWLNRTLAATPAPHPELAIAARSLDLFVDLCIGADPMRVEPRLKELKEVAAEFGQPSPPVWFAEGVERMLLHRDRSAMPLLDQAYTTLRDAGTEMHGDASMPLLLIAIGETLMADRVDAEAAAKRLVEETERAGAPWMIRWAEWCSINVEMRFGVPAEAAARLERLLRVQTGFTDQDSWLPMWVIEVLAWTAGRMRAGRRAAVLLGIGSVLNEVTGTKLDKILPFRDHHIKAKATAQRLLGEEGYRQAFNYGAQVRTLAEARSLALDEQDEPDDVANTHEAEASDAWKLLSPTQQAVAVLVAQGLSNEEIATRRYVSKRTVDTHLKQIRTKVNLGPGRGVLQAWAYQHAPSHLVIPSGSDL